MSDSVVRYWYKTFRDGRTHLHDEEVKDGHSIVTEELLQKVEQTIRTERRFTISGLSKNFPQINRTTYMELLPISWVSGVLCKRVTELFVEKSCVDGSKCVCSSNLVLKS